MAATFTTQDDPYLDGLGHGAPLGTGYVRRLTLVLDGGDTVGTVTPSQVGLTSFIGVLGIVERTAGVTAQITALSRTSLTVTASASSSTIEVVVHGRGI